MTTALVWWVVVLADLGAVAVVRARRWSPDQADPSELRSRERGAHTALLPVLFLLVLAAIVTVVVLGWNSSPPGWARVWEAPPLLATCAVTSVGVVACLVTMAGRRVGSWWLLTGLLPALGGAALLLGA